MHQREAPCRACVYPVVVRGCSTWYLRLLKSYKRRDRCQRPQRPDATLALLALFFWFVPLFLLLNLLGIALAPLGGLLGGHLRSQVKQEGQLTQEWPGERERARPWRVGMLAVIIIPIFLALLLGVAFIVLTLGTFS